MAIPTKSSLLPALVLASLGFGCGSQEASSDAPMGVLLISVDSLRADHLSSYGYKSPLVPSEPTSPTIDARLADQGMSFDQLISTTSWTVPAHMAMLSGQPDRIHGVLAPVSRLPKGRSLLAMDFQAAGWTTGGFFSGPNLHPWFGFGRGFDLYADCTTMGVDPSKFAPTDNSGRDQLRTMEDASHHGNTGELVAGRFGKWLEGLDTDERFFSFVHLWDAHYNYEPPAAFDLFDPDYTGDRLGDGIPNLDAADISERDAQHLVALYDGEIRYVDHTIGLLLDHLQSQGRLDNTLVIFTADHGEEFAEHGRYGHNKTLFDEVIHVPLIVRWPGHVPAGVRIAEQLSLVDLAPTIVELADLPVDPTHWGHSVAETLLGDGPLVLRPAPLELAIGRSDPAKKRAPMEGLRLPKLKVVRERPQMRPTFFDLDTDPGELKPYKVPGDDPRLVEVRGIWAAIMQVGAALPRETGTMPDALESELTNIGYINGDE